MEPQGLRRFPGPVPGSRQPHVLRRSPGFDPGGLLPGMRPLLYPSTLLISTHPLREPLLVSEAQCGQGRKASQDPGARQRWLLWAPRSAALPQGGVRMWEWSRTGP